MDDYNAITAYGTWAAVVVALGLPAGVWRFFLRPVLVIEFANHAPFRRQAAIVGSPTLGTFFRLKITNRGWTTAHGVVGRLGEILNRDGVPLPTFDPVALHWAGTPYGLSVSGRIDLMPGQHEFLDVIRLEFNRRDFEDPHEFHVIAQDETPRGILLHYVRQTRKRSLCFTTQESESAIGPSRLSVSSDHSPCLRHCTALRVLPMTKRKTAASRTGPQGARGRTGPKGDPGERASPDYILSVVESQFREIREQLQVQLVRTGQLQVELDRHHRELADTREQVKQIHALLSKYLRTA